jgi:hypothetical protein
MKLLRTLTLSVFILVFVSTVYGQQKFIDSLGLYFPGPAKQDSSKYCTIFLFRPSSDPFPERWQTFFIEQYPMAKIYTNSRYMIQCALTGTTIIGCNPEDKAGIPLETKPGAKFYIRFTVAGTQREPIPLIELLDDSTGSLEFNSIDVPILHIYDPDPMEMNFHGQTLTSDYVREPDKRTGFNEFLFQHPISVRHYFSSPEMGYEYTYVNKMVSSSYSEVVLIQRMADGDFKSQTEFELYVNARNGKADKKLLKKSETIVESSSIEISTPADLSFASYSVSDDTQPEGTDKKGNPFVELRTWQAYLYKKQINNNKGMIFRVTFTEKGLLPEVHSKEEIFYKMNLLLQSIQFGKAID